ASCAAAVAHPAVIEAQHGITCCGEAARHQHELAMTADAVLRPAHDDEHTDAAHRCIGAMQDAHQLFAVACEQQRALGHDAAFARKASTVARTTAEFSTISVVVQKGSPGTTLQLTVPPAARVASI